jgi:TRAP-type C4-dicarboxylate transport system substrate-binding protein
VHLILRLLLALPLLMLAAGCSGSSANKAGGQEETTLILTLANGNATGDFDVGEWVQAVEQLSGGSIRLDVKSNWRTGERDGEAATIRDVRSGRVDLAKVPARAWRTAGVSSFDALSAPFLVTSYDLERRVVSGQLSARMLRGVDAVGVVGVALLPGELQRPVGVTRDLLGPRSYEGATIAVRSELAGTVMRALEARARGAVGRLDLAAIDGAEMNLFSLDIDQYFRQAQSATTNVVLWPRALTIVMNRDAYRELTLEQQAILRKAADAALPAIAQRLRTAERGAVASACRHRFRFVTASTADIDELQQSVHGVYERLLTDSTTRAVLRRIEAIKGKAAEAERLPSCPRSGGTSTVSSPLDGTWRSSATRPEFVAAHPLPGEFPDDNYGTYTLRLLHGRFEMRNSRFPGAAGSGRFSRNGDVVTFSPGGTVEQGAGETWRYRWTLYRGTLVLRRISDVGPTAFVVNPWQRLK